MTIRILDTVGLTNEESQELVGKRVWACQYFANYGVEQPARHVQPAQFEICINELQVNTEYKGLHLRRVFKNGNLSKPRTMIYDITFTYQVPGSGNPLYYSEDENVIIEKYNELLESVATAWEVKLNRLVSSIRGLKQ